MRSDDPVEIPPMRRSKCAEESYAAERQRIRAMTPEERVRVALSLHRRLSHFKNLVVERSPK